MHGGSTLKIKNIFVFSHQGQKRVIDFNINGMNIITGRSSTGKSVLSKIVEICMGRTEYLISDGEALEKISWFGVIYQFPGIQVLVAKPAPKPGAKTMSNALLIEGIDIKIPEFNNLKINTNDDSIIKILSRHLGIPDNETDVPLESSRDSYDATIQHTYYYLFQKQNIVANEDILFYRQNEEYQPRAIKDTLPIFLGIESDDKYRLESLLRIEKRNLKLCEKQIYEVESFRKSITQDGLDLLNKAKAIGLIDFQMAAISTDQDIMLLLEEAKNKKLEVIPDTENRKLWELREAIEVLRDRRRSLQSKLDEAMLYTKKSNGFTKEVEEQKSRLESINLLPFNESGEWKWPFSEKNLAMDTPVAKALLHEIRELDDELEAVTGDKPILDAYLAKIESGISSVSDEINKYTSELSAIIEVNDTVKQLQSRNYAASQIIGRIKMYLENYTEDNDFEALIYRRTIIQNRISSLESQLGINDLEEKWRQVENAISMNITEIMREIRSEYSGFPFYFDIDKLDVSCLRGMYPIPLKKTGSAENYLAIHLSTLLGIHKFATENGRPIPRFLFIDQPSQVYFPEDTQYEDTDETSENDSEIHLHDDDLDKTRNIFKVLDKFTKSDVPGFQLIVTEHANLRDKWFQDALVEDPWTKPPALVPDEWITRSEFESN